MRASKPSSTDTQLPKLLLWVCFRHEALRRVPPQTFPSFPFPVAMKAAAVAVLALLAAPAVASPDSFVAWKAVHNKVYASPEE